MYKVPNAFVTCAEKIRFIMMDEKRIYFMKLVLNNHMNFINL